MQDEARAGASTEAGAEAAETEAEAGALRRMPNSGPSLGSGASNGRALAPPRPDICTISEVVGALEAAGETSRADLVGACVILL